MFYLQEIFDDLAYGEFANMAIGNSSFGSITPDKYPKVVSLINLGLLDLYTRFILKKKELTLYQKENKNIYYIRPEHLGYPLGGDPEIYIDDTAESVPDNDIIKFLRAYDDSGNEIRIDNIKYPNDIFLLEPDVIKMIPADPLKILSIVYQASYPKIIVDQLFNPATYELYFPKFLKMALLAHVASRLFVGKTTKTTEGETNLGNTFQYRYETECNRIETLNLTPEIDEVAEQFYSNGWV